MQNFNLTTYEYTRELETRIKTLETIVEKILQESLVSSSTDDCVTIPGLMAYWL